MESSDNRNSVLQAWVSHPEKAEMPEDAPIEARVNAPLTPQGVIEANEIAASLIERFGDKLGPIVRHGITDRCYGIASALCLRDERLDPKADRRLAQWANGGDGWAVYYPGHAEDSYQMWQMDAVEIAFTSAKIDDPSFVSVFSTSRPLIGGILAHIEGIAEEQAIKERVKAMGTGGIYFFRVYDDGTITLES